MRATEFFLGNRLTEGAFHQSRPTDHHLRGLLGHDREMRGDQTGRGQAGYGSQCGGRNRHHGHGLHDRHEPGRGVHRLRTPGRFTAVLPTRDTPAAAFEEANEGQPVATRQLFGPHALAKAGGRGRAALKGKVLTTNHTGAARNLAEADNIIRGGKRTELALLVGFGVTGNRPLFAERVGIEQLVHTLADGQSPPVMLLGHRFRPA